jgi:hypothetical protein
MATKVRHYLHSNDRAVYLVYDYSKCRKPDMYLTFCGQAYISKSGQPERWANPDASQKVTCRRCIAAGGVPEGLK